MTMFGELHHHLSHLEHKLELRYGERPFRCNGCHQIGFGSPYKYDEPFSWCDFHLHKDCACPKDTITHPFFPDCVFHFLVSPDEPGSSYCAACGLDIVGYNYHCFDKERDLHPSCATLPDSVSESKEVTLKLSKKLTAKCYKCKERALSNKRNCWSYVSECGERHLHVNCVKDMLIESWEREEMGRRQKEKGDRDDEKAVAKREQKVQHIMSSKMIHPSHPEHELKLEHKVAPYICNGCWQLGFYSRYECSNCEFYLHKDCAQAIHQPSTTHQFFPGCHFAFLESPFGPGRHCDACGLDIKGYNYHCYEEGWDLHPSCATLPYTRIEDDVVLELSQERNSKCYKCRKKRMRGNRKSWSYVSACREFHLHVACVKDMLLENWKMSEVSNERAVVRREQKLHIVLDKSKRRSCGRFGRYMKIVKIALSFIMAAIVGDPTALVVGVISSLISH